MLAAVGAGLSMQDIGYGPPRTRLLPGAQVNKGSKERAGASVPRLSPPQALALRIVRSI